MTDFCKVLDAKNMRQGISVHVIITKKGDKRQVNLKAGGTAYVCDLLVEDDSDSIKLTLWDDDIDKVKVGSMLEIINGYTSFFRGECALSKGKYGEMNVT